MNLLIALITVIVALVLSGVALMCLMIWEPGGGRR